VKRRFALIAICPKYTLDVQALLVAAICALHNFIRIHDPDDIDDLDLLAELERRSLRRHRDSGAITRAERDRAEQRRDEIAHAMWRQYVEYIQFDT
jgi:hypothetical protein